MSGLSAQRIARIRANASLRRMVALAMPMIVTHLSLTIMQLVDRAMVAKLGTEALAAILPASMIAFVPCSFALGAAVSINTYVSQSLGKRSYKDCASYCWQGIFMGLAYAAVVVAVLWPMAPGIFKAMRHDPQVIAMEVSYLRVILYSQGFMMIIWTGTQFFMGIHRPRVNMYSAIAAHVINIFCNWLLIFGNWGFPEMGIEGAAWGTFIGTGIGAGIRMVVFLTGWINSQYGGREMMRLCAEKMRHLVRVGFPTGLGMLINSALVGIYLVWLVGLSGKAGQAATTVIWTCLQVASMPIIGISTALTASAGKAIGKGKKDLVIEQTKFCSKIGVIYMGLIGVAFFIFRGPIMRLWSPDADVISNGMNIFVCAAIFQVFYAANIVYNGALRGAGDTKWLAIVGAASAIIIMVCGGWCLVQFAPQLGALGPWIAGTAHIIVTGIAYRWRFKSNKWRKIDIFKQDESPLESLKVKS